MRAVLLTKQVPWPADSGGRIREAHVAEVFRQRADEVHVLGFGQQPPPELVPDGVTVHAVEGPDLLAGTARARSAAVGRWYSRALRRRAAALLRDGDHLHVGFSQMVVDAPSPARVDSLDLHNVESDLLAQRARGAARVLRPLLRAEAVRLRAWERRVGRVPLLTCVSEPDRRRLAELGLSAVVAPNGTTLPPEVAPLPPGPSAVFVGTLDWAPNVEGLQWFTAEVWPQVRRLRPAARLSLVGRDPAPSVTALAGDGVTVTGRVTAVGPAYAAARLAVVPLLTGGGSRLKVLEALAHGRPVVSTSLGAEGLEALEGRGVVLADGAPALARAVADLLDDPHACARLGAAGRDAVAAEWSWPAVLQPLAAALEGRP